MESNFLNIEADSIGSSSQFEQLDSAELAYRKAIQDKAYRDSMAALPTTGPLINIVEKNDSIESLSVKVGNLPIYYNKNYFSSSEFYTEAKISNNDGISGDPVHYHLMSDDSITGIVLLCFFLMSMVLSGGKRFLLQQIQEFDVVRERSSIFSIEVASEFRNQLLLTGQTIFILATLFFDYTMDSIPEVFENVSPYVLLGLDTLVCASFFVIKFLMYSFVNNTFFEQRHGSLWLESYWLVVSLSGIALFPLLLLVVYFDLSIANAIIYLLVVMVIAKILLFYKALSIFFNKNGGLFYLIVYFCALEIMPSIYLWQALVFANNCLIIKN